MFQPTSKSRQRKCTVSQKVKKSVPSRRSGTTERASPACRQSDSRNAQPATASRPQVPATTDVGDWPTELGQTSGSHAVPTPVHPDAQPEPDPAGDAEPVQSLAPELSQTRFANLRLQRHFTVYRRRRHTRCTSGM